MGMRKYQRAIAKARLKTMGVKSNALDSGFMPQGNELRKKMKYRDGRALLEKIRKEHPARWVRVTTGDLAKEGLKAQLLEGQRIKKRKMVQDSMKKRKVRKISAPAN